MKTFSETHANAIMKLCPRFLRCSAPICPLDLLQEKRSYIKGEPKCGLSKSRRIKIAKGTSLLRRGMTKREWSAYKYWQDLTEAEREKNFARLRAILCFCMRNSDPIKDLSDKTRINENHPKTLMQK
jgi:hypothetical protein